MPLIVSFITDFIVRDLLGIMFPEMTQTMLSLGLLFIAYGVWRYEFPELSPAVAAERIVGIMPNFLLITDPEGRINRWSRSIEEKLLYTELRGQYVWSIFEPSEASMLREIVSSSSSAEMETRILSADGRHWTSS